MDSNSSNQKLKDGESDDNEENDPMERETEKVPILINLSINLIITFALSLSIYLLMANIFLTINKITMHTSSMTKGANSFSKTSISNNENDKTSYQFYDCSKSILSIEECQSLNSYHDEYLNSLRSYLTRQSNGNGPLKQPNSLKVNTSFFVH